jgi:hypothetical protein
VNSPVWLVVRRQTAKTGGIKKECFTIQHSNDILLLKYLSTEMPLLGGFNNIAFPHDLTSGTGYATVSFTLNPETLIFS